MKIKLIIAASVAIGLAACGGPYTLNAAERQVAELGARQFAGNMNADFVQCAGIDSDKDGTVTCTIRNRLGPGTMTLSCSYKMDKKNGGAVGCKRKTA